MTPADTPTDPAKDALLQAALAHVPFDGWSETTFRAAAQDAGVDLATARALFPRGAVDMALAFHKAGDAAMVARLRAEDLSGLRFRDRIAQAVRYRLEAVEDREAVRRGTTLFALPIYAADGARAIWGTADAIWTALGDSSRDLNWYTKRATLSGVYAATVLYWLGDDSPGHQATWDFLDRRIGDVMQFEKVKAGVLDNPLMKRVLSGPIAMAERMRPPGAALPEDMPDLPGRWRRN